MEWFYVIAWVLIYMKLCDFYHNPNISNIPEMSFGSLIFLPPTDKLRQLLICYPSLKFFFLWNMSYKWMFW